MSATPEQRAAYAASKAAEDAPKYKYDKFKNRTVVSVEGRFEKSPLNSASFWAAYSYEGEPKDNKGKPSAVTLMISTSASDWVFLKRSRETIFLTDSGRFAGQYEHDGKAGIAGSGQYSSVYVAEHMTMLIEPAIFRSIALNSTPVEFSLGGYVFQFGPRGMNKLKGLLESFEPPSVAGLPGTSPTGSSNQALPGSAVEVSTMSGTRSLVVGSEVVLVVASGAEISGTFVGTAGEHVELVAAGETKRIKVVELKDARPK